MSTIYLHIPFCKQACHYCDFHFSTLKKTYPPVIAAMKKELDVRADYLATKKISSIYFGGGTPSLLEEKDLAQFLNIIHKNYDVEEGAEVTLEANPDDLSLEKLRFLKAAGINRLSIGTQSFFNNELELMNRSHNADQARACIKNAQDLGIENITIDLMFGLPDSNLKTWEQNVQTAIALGVPHISAYSLTIEPKTALHKMVSTGQIKLPNEEMSLAQYALICKQLKEAGFLHYELSNYGKPGFESRHNTSYWNGTPYLGIGPSAHSFDGKTRQWNIANNSLYAKNISSQTDWFEMEELEEKDRFNEYLMTGLRTAKGISLSKTDAQFGYKRADKLLSDAQGKLECKKLELKDDVLFIPEHQWMLSDSIISDLFWV